MHRSSSQITPQFLPPVCHTSSKQNIKIWLKLRFTNKQLYILRNEHGLLHQCEANAPTTWSMSYIYICWANLLWGWNPVLCLFIFTVYGNASQTTVQYTVAYVLGWPHVEQFFFANTQAHLHIDWLSCLHVDICICTECTQSHTTGNIHMWPLIFCICLFIAFLLVLVQIRRFLEG